MSDDPLETLVPEGDYFVVFERCEQGREYGSKRLFVHFRTTAGLEQEKLLLRVYGRLREGSLWPVVRTSSLISRR